MTLQRRSVQLALPLLAALAIVLSTAPSAGAAACTTTWNGNNGAWNTAGEWSANAVPGTSDVVCISAGQATLTGTAATVKEVQITGTGELIVDNTALTADDPITASTPDGPVTVAAGASVQETAASSSIAGGSLVNAG